MNEPTRTTTTLLDGLADSDNAEAWSSFDARYRPILVGFARRFGLEDADAADVAQDVLTRFVQEFRDGRYDRSRGRLRSWLVSMAHDRSVTLLRRSAVRRVARGESALDERSEVDVLSNAWEEERRRVVLRTAFDELRDESRTDPRTIRAFELLFMHGLEPDVVASECGMSVQDVYRAKSRVAQRLRAIVARLESAYEGEV